MRFISIIVPCFNEERYIQNCIDSIVLQDYQHDQMEVFFLDGMSTDNTRKIISAYCQKHSFIKLLDNKKRSVPVAMNIGINNSKGDFIIRLDAHSFYPENYFSKLIEYAEKLNADNVGGIGITEVKNKNKKSLAIREVLSNKFGVGDSKFRIGTNKIIEVDTVIFGCFKKDVFNRFGYYDERLWRNQDIELNKRIKNGGGKLYLVPEIQCTYFARETFKDLMVNNFQNGLWNILTVHYTKALSSLSLRHFIPFIFVISLIIPPILAIGYFPLIIIGIISLLIYLIFLLANSIYLSKKKNLNFFYLIVSFFVLHISYGSGSLVALIKLPFLKR